MFYSEQNVIESKIPLRKHTDKCDFNSTNSKQKLICTMDSNIITSMSTNATEPAFSKDYQLPMTYALRFHFQKSTLG